MLNRFMRCTYVNPERAGGKRSQFSSGGLGASGVWTLRSLPSWPPPGYVATNRKRRLKACEKDTLKTAHLISGQVKDKVTTRGNHS